MKILLAATQFYPEFGGIESSIYYMAKALKRLNHEPVVFTGRTRDKLPLQDEIEGIRIIRYPFIRYKNIFGIFHPLSEKSAIDKNLAGLLKKENFDAIWARHSFFICAAVRCRFKGKTVYIPAMVKKIFEENEILNLKAYLLKRIVWATVRRAQIYIVEYFERIALRQAGRVIVFSNVVKKMFRDYYKIPNERFEVIHPGVDIVKFKPALPDTALRKKLGIDKERKIFTYVGRVTKGKKVDLLLDAFSLIKGVEAVLIIVGSSPELDILKALADKLGISDRVYFTGYQRDVFSYHSISDFLVTPSDLEGFGHVYLEAMASGVPCIAFRTDYPKVRVATEEIIIDNKTGFLVDKVNASFLAEKMQEVLRLSHDDYKRMSECARQYVVNEFSWEKFVTKII